MTLGIPKICTKVWLEVDDMHIFGSGLAGLLDNIDHLGTLTAAANKSNMSYRHAWNLVRRAEGHLGRQLVHRRPGGPGGGHSALSPAARHLLQSFRMIKNEIAGYADERFAALFSQEEDS
jgi:molybdate transport system regulatory protein